MNSSAGPNMRSWLERELFNFMASTDSCRSYQQSVSS